MLGEVGEVGEGAKGIRYRVILARHLDGGVFIGRDRGADSVPGMRVRWVGRASRFSWRQNRLKVGGISQSDVCRNCSYKSMAGIYEPMPCL